jgi:hypothetical protein
VVKILLTTSTGEVWRGSPEDGWTNPLNSLPDGVAHVGYDQLAYIAQVPAHGSDDTLWRSSDAGVNWDTATLPAVAWITLAEDGGLFALGDFGSGFALHESTDQGDNWTELIQVPNTSDPDEVQTVYHLRATGDAVWVLYSFVGTAVGNEYQDHKLFRWNRSTSSVDLNVTLPRVEWGAGGGQQPGQLGSQHLNPNTVWVVRQFVNDAPTVFTPDTPGDLSRVTTGATILTAVGSEPIAVAPTRLANVIYVFASVGASDPAVFRVENAVAVNVLEDAGLNPFQQTPTIYVTTDGAIWAAGTGGTVWRSQDDGANWTQYTVSTATGDIESISEVDFVLFQGLQRMNPDASVEWSKLSAF